MVGKLLRICGILVLLGLLALGATAGVLWVLGPPTYEGYAPEAFVLDAEGDPAVGKRLVELTCVRCHYDPETDTLAGRSLAPSYAALGAAYASNITRDEVRGIGEWSDEALVMLLRSGVHPQRKTLLPPSMPFLPNIADVDLAHVVAYLRSDDAWVAPERKADPRGQLGFSAVLAAWLQWKPGADRAALVLRPEEAEPVALGGYLANDLLQCHGCHSASLTKVDWVVPADTPGFYAGGAELRDLAGNRIVAPGLSAREDGGLGGWSYEAFRRALTEGVGPEGDVLRWPMPRYTALTEGELTALYAYFETLPAAAKAPKRPDPYEVSPAIVDPGRHTFERLGCPSCHVADAEGELGLGSIVERFPDDAALAGYVSDPRSVDPGAWMPAYGHLIDDAQMAELVEYLRRRVERGPYAPPPKE